MTEDQLIHKDETDRLLTVAYDRGGESAWLYVSDEEGDTGYGLTVPRYIAAALRLAADLGPDAVLRDIAPLLAQCDREDINPRPESRFLNTREIRHLLGLASPCGRVERALAGARCTLPEHGEDTWHVDPDKRLRWRHNAEKELDVRGWAPDTADDEAVPASQPPATEADFRRKLRDYTVNALDTAGVDPELNPDHARQVLRAAGLDTYATDAELESFQALRRQIRDGAP